MGFLYEGGKVWRGALIMLALVALGLTEVVLKNTGAVLHSKKCGKGKCESRAEQQAVVDSIHVWLDKQ
jgi:hypothetical protein